MAKIDEIKEEINYLKVWLSLIVVTTIGLIGWLVTHFEEISVAKVILSVITIIVLSTSILPLDKQIKKKIRSLREL